MLQTLFANFPWRTAALVLTAIMAAFMAIGCVLVETKVPKRQQQQQQEDERADDEEGEAAEPPAKVSHVLTSPKFWLISYAIFGIPPLHLFPPRVPEQATTELIPDSRPPNSLRACPLHPMGLHPLVRRGRPRRGQAVLPDHVVQRVSVPQAKTKESEESQEEHKQQKLKKTSAVAPSWDAPCPPGSATGPSGPSTPPSP